jgi:hypothetical protein
VVNSYAYSGNVTDGYYLDNLVTEASYFVNQGYSPYAAAGIAGATAGESSGNPEAVGSGGAGLIGWTPPGKAAPYQPIVTGDPTQDFAVQLPDVAYYNQQQGPQAMQDLQQQTNPVAAADIYSQEFERPLVTDSDVRPDVANYVYNSITGKPTAFTTAADKNTGSGPTANPGNVSLGTATLTSFNPLNPASWISSDMWERVGLVIFGALLVLVGVFMLAGKQTIKIASTAAEAGAV